MPRRRKRVEMQPTEPRETAAAVERALRVARERLLVGAHAFRDASERDEGFRELPVDFRDVGRVAQRPARVDVLLDWPSSHLDFEGGDAERVADVLGLGDHLGRGREPDAEGRGGSLKYIGET